MTEADKPKNTDAETVSMEAFNNVVNVLKETSEIIGIKKPDEEFSLDQMRNLPEQVRKIKNAGDQAEQNHAKYRMFVEESLKANIKHLDDAYTLANKDLAKTEVDDDSPKKIKVIIDQLRETRPYLFNEPEHSSDIPTDFLVDDNCGSNLEALRQKALQTGSPNDLQKYWSARRQIR